MGGNATTGAVAAAAARIVGRIGRAEDALSRAFSSKMSVAECVNEGNALARSLHLSPYATGVYDLPPLFLLAREYWWQSGLANAIAAVLVYRLVGARASSRGVGRTLRIAASAFALLVGHRLGLGEASVLLALLGASTGNGGLTEAGIALALYASPSDAFLLVHPLRAILLSRSEGGRSPISYRRFLAKIGLAWFALIVASALFMKWLLPVPAFREMNLMQVTHHWMERAYVPPMAANGGADAFAPSASLAWYFNVQMFPEMQRMFGLLGQAQPALLALPMALTLGAAGSELHYLLAQVVICNHFRRHYELGTFLVEAVLFVLLQVQGAPRGGGGRASAGFFAIGASGLICVSLLLAVRALWIDYGVANSNYYWAVALCFNLSRLALAQAAMSAAMVKPGPSKGDQDTTTTKKKKV